MTETAWAKLNLGLHVRRRRPDGYHEIETLFAFADIGDVLTAEPHSSLELKVSGRFAGDLDGSGDNLVLKAARTLQKACGVERGARLVLDKRLPVASGIGGGSADAAAALRLLARLWDVSPPLALVQDIAAGLGADVPACLASETALGTGLGGQLTPVHPPGLRGTPALLVNPGLPCSTGPVFTAWDGIDRGPLDWREWRQARNDLEGPARAVLPRIGAVLEVLAAQKDAGVARMSGSGATCFALFEDVDACASAARALAHAHPDWWVQPARLR